MRPFLICGGFLFNKIMKLTKRKGFTFLRSYFDVFNKLQTDEQKLSFLNAIINKQFLNEDPKELNFPVDLAWDSQINAIDSSVKGWIRAEKTDLQGNLLNPLPTPPRGKSTTPPKEEEEEEKEKEKEKEEEEEKEKVQVIKKEVFNFRKSLIAFGFNERLVDDWMKVRKTKKATNTETALNSFLNECKRSNLENDSILQLCIERDWKGFKNEWLENKQNKNNDTNKPKSRLDRFIGS